MMTTQQPESQSKSFGRNWRSWSLSAMSSLKNPTKRRSQSLRSSRYSRVSWTQQTVRNGKSREWRCMPGDTSSKPWNVSKGAAIRSCSKKLRRTTVLTVPPKSWSKLSHSGRPLRINWFNTRKWVTLTWRNWKRSWKSRNCSHFLSFKRQAKYLKSSSCLSKLASAISVVENIKPLMRTSARPSWISRPQRVYKCWINIGKPQSTTKKKGCILKLSNAWTW